jgi:hypothetical protein
MARFGTDIPVAVAVCAASVFFASDHGSAPEAPARDASIVAFNATRYVMMVLMS